MAMTGKPLFLYGYTITTANQLLDFKIASSGAVLTAIVPVGYYSLTSLLVAVASALASADSTNTYSATADRSINGGLENRVTLASSGAFLSLMFQTGPNAGSSIAAVLGFAAADRTGATSYTGTFTTGTAFVPFKNGIPGMTGYGYIDPNFYQKNQGVVNTSASGNRETVVFSTQKYTQAQFKYIPGPGAAQPDEVTTGWVPLLQWMTRGRPFEFAPSIAAGNTFYAAYLDSTAYDSSGLGFKLSEQIGDGFPFYYDTGMLVFQLAP